MKEISVEQLNENVFSLIGKEWMLVTAGTPERYNMMTASWGGIGWLWNRPVAFVFIRPERYTYEFVEQSQTLTLSFLGDAPQMRQLYGLLGSKSGRDIPKMQLDGLTAEEASNGCVRFSESRLTLECTKLFATDMQEDNFICPDLLAWYGEKGGMHRMYVVEITRVLTAD
ncbi:MAG: flavin reductase [Bacteroidaceae bacterium]|nr:flavin reductase [Bacteroidaceae bacterium]